MDKATVIIPCYNVEAYILDCLDSVVLQGDVVHHTYVVDNNSTDDTVDKVREWQNVNPNFGLTLLSETKPGAPAARNLPLNRVETKWIQFLDADDILLREKIEDQVRNYHKGDVICAGFQRVSLRGEKTPALPNPNIPLALIQGAAGITSSNLFSTRSIKSVKGWDETLMSSQEYDLMFRIWQTGAEFDVDLKPRAIVRAREYGQISQQNPTEKWTRFIDLRMKMLGSMGNSLTNPYEKEEILQSIFDFVRILFPFDHRKATSIYRELRAKGLEPKRSATSSWKYIIVMRIFGFYLTEKILTILRPKQQPF